METPFQRTTINRGFHPSPTDNCLYIHHDCILVIYTDDCLIFAKEPSTIDALIKDLEKDYLIGDTGSVQDFLGIHITKDNQRFYPTRSSNQ